MNLLGLSGKKGVGKNTVASILKDVIGAKQNVFEIAFADALKKEVGLACGCTKEYIDKHKSVFRPILQWWGTDFRRVHQGKDNYWTEQLLKKLVTYPNNCTVIITDVRFPNEADIIKRAGGQLWRIVRIEDKPLQEVDGHHSEIALDDYEHFDEVVVNNCKTIEELRPKVINLYNKYYGNSNSTASKR